MSEQLQDNQISQQEREPDLPETPAEQPVKSVHELHDRLRFSQVIELIVEAHIHQQSPEDKIWD